MFKAIKYLYLFQAKESKGYDYFRFNDFIVSCAI